MYIGTDKRLRSIHRHIKVEGKKLTDSEMNFLREQLKLSKESELVPEAILAGYPIKAVVTNYEVGRVTTTVKVEVSDEEVNNNTI